jgi:glycosyltransferase involved in cell wall biosynthesis
MTQNPRFHIGFISVRFAGTDGVSLETDKWAKILAGLGHECFYFAGETDRPTERSYVVPEAHFQHPQIEALTKDLFDDYLRSSDTTGQIHMLRYYLKQQLYQFIMNYAIDVIIAENILSLPVNIPLGLALAELIAETQIPTIAHHHDFTWERSRYSVSAASDYLHAAFPPLLNSVNHVVINSFAANQLALRTGANSTLVPNVMDFDSPPSPPDEWSETIRPALGIAPDQSFLLQPTRIVPRKRIEFAIELARRLDLDQGSKLVITHKSGDEGSAYERYLRDYADLIGVQVVFGSEIVNHYRAQLADGTEVYSLADAYQNCDLVTYPSTIEGFGNAFLETIYYKRPIVISSYEIFRTDIQPKGFDVIVFNDFIEDETVEKARAVLAKSDFVEEMVEHNYTVGRQYYSFTSLERQLQALLARCLGC